MDSYKSKKSNFTKKKETAKKDILIKTVQTLMFILPMRS